MLSAMLSAVLSVRLSTLDAGHGDVGLRAMALRSHIVVGDANVAYLLVLLIELVVVPGYRIS